MYTIHQGINGGWYGSVTADRIDTALSEARALAAALVTLRETNPKPLKAAKSPSGTPELNAQGEACLAYLRDNPRALNEDYTQVGHSQRTVTWLVKQGFVRFDPATNTWAVLDRA